MGQYLLLVHIGPVQDFIASARRSRDLWFGSWMLSELAKAAAKAIADRSGKDSLIFPPPDLDLNPGSDVGVANRIVVVVDNPAEVVEPVRAATWRRLAELREDAFDKLKEGSLRDTEAAIRQVMNLPEFFWAAVPLSDDYRATRRRAEALLAARKNTRDFEPVSWGDWIPKSSLDGERESMIPEEAYPNWNDNETVRSRKIEALYRHYRARRAERLSGVDLLKRLGQERRDEAQFPSTSHMAARPLLHHLSTKAGIDTAWKQYTNRLPNWMVERESVHARYTTETFGRVDGSVLFVSRLAETLEGQALQQAREALEAFLGGREPGPYYALLLGDGDGMGQVIDYQQTPEAHRALSRQLNEFARGVRKIVEEEHQGALVYAGGDDVLAFLPLHTALPCTAALAKRFCGMMEEWHDGEGRPATFSAGIAVSHHLEPMSNALNLARRAERLAKSTPGKNALAIVIDKRGGVSREVVGRWGEIDRLLDRFIEFDQRNLLPGGFAYELRDTVLTLGGDNTVRQDSSLAQVLLSEAERILGRKRAPGGTARVAPEVAAAIGEVLRASDSSMENLANLLITARLFASARNTAGLQPKIEEKKRDNLVN